MTSDPERVRQALEGTTLAGLQVRSVPIPLTDDVAFFIDIHSSEIRQAWQAGRDVARSIQRVAVATHNWGLSDEELLSRDSGEAGGDESPGAVVERSRGLSLDEGLAHYRWRHSLGRFSEGAWESIVRSELDVTARRVGSAPPLEQAMALDEDPLALDALLFEWEEARAPTGEPSGGEGYLEWFDPEEPVLLVLLPTSEPAHIPAYLSYFHAEGRGGHEGLIAVLRSWRERYGAELVTSWGTMLELDVARPPEEIRDAYKLATEQYLIAPGTSVGPGFSVRDHARMLLGRPEWHLHEHP